jgi:hypothetical protein
MDPGVIKRFQSWKPSPSYAPPPEVTEELKAAAEKLFGGKADGRSDTEFNPAAIAAGVQVEREHTSNKAVQKEIAKDHLSEDPSYYQKLEKMEKKGFEQFLLKSAKEAPAPKTEKPKSTEKPKAEPPKKAKPAPKHELNIPKDQPNYQHTQLFTKLLEKSPVPVKLEPKAYTHPEDNGFYDFVNKRIRLLSPNHDSLAHEIGHAQYDETPLGWALQSRALYPQIWSTPFASIAGGVTSGLLRGSGSLKGQGTASLLNEAAGLLAPLLLSAPALWSEYNATTRGRKLLEGVGATPEELDHYDKGLWKSYKSYLTLPTISALGGAVMYGLSALNAPKFGSEKTADWKDILLGAGKGAVLPGLFGAAAGALTDSEDRARGALKGGLTGAAIGAIPGGIQGHLEGKATAANQALWGHKDVADHYTQQAGDAARAIERWQYSPPDVKLPPGGRTAVRTPQLHDLGKLFDRYDFHTQQAELANTLADQARAHWQHLGGQAAGMNKWRWGAVPAGMLAGGLAAYAPEKPEWESGGKVSSLRRLLHQGSESCH